MTHETPCSSLTAMQGDVIRLQEQSKTLFGMFDKIEKRLGRIEIFIGGVVMALAAVALQYVGKTSGLIQ